jgi:hypothetical protein
MSASEPPSSRPNDAWGEPRQIDEAFGISALPLRQPRIDRRPLITIVRHDRKQFLHPFCQVRSHNADLRKMRPQCIHQLGTPTCHENARAVLHQLTLLLGGLDPHDASSGAEPPRRSPRRRQHRSCCLDVGLHILHQHQSNFAAEFRHFPAQWCAAAQAPIPIRQGGALRPPRPSGEIERRSRAHAIRFPWGVRAAPFTQPRKLLIASASGSLAFTGLLD